MTEKLANAESQLKTKADCLSDCGFSCKNLQIEQHEKLEKAFDMYAEQFKYNGFIEKHLCKIRQLEKDYAKVSVTPIKPDEDRLKELAEKFYPKVDLSTISNGTDYSGNERAAFIIGYKRALNYSIVEEQSINYYSPIKVNDTK